MSESEHTPGPECPYCGTTEGLRQVHDGGGFVEPEYTCAGCFAAQDDGPCFDDLALLHCRCGEPYRAIIDGDPLCQRHCDQWVRGEANA
jgi:hypothetical protein